MELKKIFNFWYRTPIKDIHPEMQIIIYDKIHHIRNYPNTFFVRGKTFLYRVKLKHRTVYTNNKPSGIVDIKVYRKFK